MKIRIGPMVYDINWDYHNADTHTECFCDTMRYGK